MPVLVPLMIIDGVLCSSHRFNAIARDDVFVQEFVANLLMFLPREYSIHFVEGLIIHNYNVELIIHIHVLTLRR